MSAQPANLADLRQPTPFRDMKPKDQVAYLLQQKKGEIAKVLPKHLNPERLLKIAQVAATTTPKLLECYLPTLVSAIGQCAQMGLEPNTVLGHAYLVPYFNNKKRRMEVQVIIGYKGLIDLARRSGQIVSIAAHAIYSNDKFECAYGLEEKLLHVPAMTGERGDIVGFYAVAHMKDGGHAFEVMTLSQVRKIAAASQSRGESGPWKDHFVEMGRKTAIRRLAKFLPLSVEFQTAAALDSMAAEGRPQDLDERTIDGDFAWLPEDETGAAGSDDGDQGAGAGQQVDPDTGEIQQQARAALPDDPSPDAPRQDLPSQAEREAIARQEAVEAQSQADPFGGAPAPQQRRRRTMGD